MKLKFLNSEYRKAKRQIKNSIKNCTLSTLMEYKPNYDYIYKWLEDEGYYIEYANATTVYISCEHAKIGKALKSKQRAMKEQYIYLMQLIEYKQSKGEKSLRIYSKYKVILQDVEKLLELVGCKLTQNVIIVDDEQWNEFEITW